MSKLFTTLLLCVALLQLCLATKSPDLTKVQSGETNRLVKELWAPFKKNKSRVKVYCAMVADLPHYGHKNFLKKSKAAVRERVGHEKDVQMIVGICNDEVVKGYKRLPVLNMEERKKVVANFKDCDGVLGDAPFATTKEWMEKHGIDYVTGVVEPGETEKAKEYNNSYQDPMSMGQFIPIDRTPGISTTDIIGLIRDLTMKNGNGATYFQHQDPEELKNFLREHEEIGEWAQSLDKVSPVDIINRIVNRTTIKEDGTKVFE